MDDMASFHHLKFLLKLINIEISGSLSTYKACLCFIYHYQVGLYPDSKFLDISQNRNIKLISIRFPLMLSR